MVLTMKRSEAEWLALFTEQEQSGLSQSAFCKAKGLDSKYFNLRKRMLMKKPDATQSQSAFVSLEPVNEDQNVEAEMVSIRVIELSVRSSSLQSTLQTILRADAG